MGLPVNQPEHSRLHERIRADHATEVAEDYVEAIDDVQREKGICRAVDLARRFGVSHVTVSRTIGRLTRDGYVETEPYGPIRLTTKGKRVATQARNRHDIVYQFLLALGVGEQTAAIDSEGIEHHVSRETLRAMERFTRRDQG
ncbi:MAG: transcriptional regulator MntR [Planctomycetota bacterium]|nr:MAG: transcriptional regulator MntR [Planctomycetota bacterium]